MKILTIVSLITCLINPNTKDIVNNRLKNSTGYNGIDNNLAQASYVYTTGEPSFSYGLNLGAVSGEMSFPLEYYLDITINFRRVVEYCNCSLTITFPATNNYYLNYVGVNCQITSANTSVNNLSFNAYNTDVCTIRLVFTLECLHDNYNYDNPTPTVTNLHIPWVEHGYDYVDIVSFSMNTIIYPTETDYTPYIDSIEGYIDGLEGVLGNSYTELQDISDYLANISTNSTLINSTLTNIDTNIASVNSRLSTISSNLSRANYIAEYVANVQTTNDFGIKKLPNDLVIKNTYRENQGRGYYAPVYYSSNTIAQMQKAYIVIHLKDIHTSYEWYYMPVPYFYDVTQNITTYPELVRNLTFIDMQTKYIYQLRIAFKCEYDDDSGFNLTSVKLNMYRVSATSASTALSAVTTASYVDFLYYAEGTFEPNLDMTNTNNMINQLLDYWNKSGSDIGINQTNEQTVGGFWGQAKQIVDNYLPLLSPGNTNDFWGTDNTFQIITNPIGRLIANNGIYKYGIFVVLLTILVKVVL